MTFKQAPIEAVTGPVYRALSAIMNHPDYHQVNNAILNYRHWIDSYFSREHDHFRLLGQDNFRRYLPLRDIRVRALATDSLFSLFARAYAAHLLGCHPTISFPTWTAELEFLQQATETWAGGIEFIDESDDELMEALKSGCADRLRYAGPNLAPTNVRAAAHQANIPIIETEVLGEGRIELLWYLCEQSISHDYHRYGNLGPRSEEKRRAVV